MLALGMLAGHVTLAHAQCLDASPRPWAQRDSAAAAIVRLERRTPVP